MIVLSKHTPGFRGCASENKFHTVPSSAQRKAKNSWDRESHAVTHIIRERFEFKVNLNLMNSGGFSYSSECHGMGRREIKLYFLKGWACVFLPGPGVMVSSIILLPFIFLSSSCIHHLFPWEAREDCGKCSTLEFTQAKGTCSPVLVQTDSEQMHNLNKFSR